MKMNKDDVYKVIDELRENRDSREALIRDRILNYIEANLDEFIECYEEQEEQNANR